MTESSLLQQRGPQQRSSSSLNQEPATIGYLRRGHFCSIFLGWLLCFVSCWAFTAARGQKLVWVTDYSSYNATTTGVSSNRLPPLTGSVTVQGNGRTHGNTSAFPSSSSSSSQDSDSTGLGAFGIVLAPYFAFLNLYGSLGSVVGKYFPCSEYGSALEHGSSIYRAAAILMTLCGIFLTLCVAFVVYKPRNRHPFFIRELERAGNALPSCFSIFFLGLLFIYTTVVLSLVLASTFTPLVLMTKPIREVCASAAAAVPFPAEKSLVDIKFARFGTGFWLLVAAALGQLLGTLLLTGGLIVTWVQMKREHLASMPQLTPVASDAEDESDDDDDGDGDSPKGSEEEEEDDKKDKESSKDDTAEECCLICMRLRAGKQKTLPDRRCASCKTGALYHTSCLTKWWAASKGKKFCPTCRMGWEDYTPPAPLPPVVTSVVPAVKPPEHRQEEAETSPLLPPQRNRPSMTNGSKEEQKKSESEMKKRKNSSSTISRSEHTALNVQQQDEL